MENIQDIVDKGFFEEREKEQFIPDFCYQCQEKENLKQSEDVHVNLSVSVLHRLIWTLKDKTYFESVTSFVDWKFSKLQIEFFQDWKLFFNFPPIVRMIEDGEVPLTWNETIWVSFSILISFSFISFSFSLSGTFKWWSNLLVGMKDYVILTFGKFTKSSFLFSV